LQYATPKEVFRTKVSFMKICVMKFDVNSARIGVERCRDSWQEALGGVHILLK